MKKELKIGIFFLIVFAVFAYFIIKTDSLMSLMSRGRSYPVYAKFPTVSGLFASAPVRLSGVRIGSVEDIYLEGEKAVVKMLIKNKHTMTDDARATIASVGLVGENFIEIFYRDADRTDNPPVIKPGGEIKTITKLGLEAIGDEFQKITPKINSLLDSMNNVLGDRQNQASLKITLQNLGEASENLKKLSGDSGAAGKTFGKLNQTVDRLKETLDSLNRFVENLDRSLYKEDSGILRQLETVAGDLKKIVKKIDNGEGSAGKLLTDDGLYKKLDDSVASVQTLLKDLEKKKESLDKTAFGYYAGIDYLAGDDSGDDSAARFAFGVNVDFSKFSLLTRVRDDVADGDPRFTLLAGKRFKHFTAAAGMVDSGLGAALYLDLFHHKLNLQVEASRFYKHSNPLLNTLLSFSLNKNINLTAGYQDLLSKETRRFLVGISLTQ